MKNSCRVLLEIFSAVFKTSASEISVRENDHHTLTFGDEHANESNVKTLET